MKRSLFSLTDAVNGRNIPPYGFSFFSEFPVGKKKKKHFLTSCQESKYLSTLAYEVAETLLYYSTC